MNAFAENQSMSIPSKEVFESFLGRCSIHRERPDGKFIALSNERRAMRSGAAAQDYFLKYPDDGIELAAVIKKIGESLLQAGVPNDRQVAIAALALMVESRPSDMSAVEHANHCLEAKQPARLTQSIVIPGRLRGDYQLALGTYQLRAFGAEKILYWAQRCGSAFPIDLRELNGWAELGREPLDLVLLDWSEPILNGPMLTRWGADVTSEAFLDNYYAAVAKAIAGTVKERIKTDVLILESAAMLWIGIESLLSMVFLKIVSLFVWTKEERTAGWATYSDQSILHANFPDQYGIAECRNWLRSELGFVELSETRLFDGTVRTYCQFLQRAHSHRIDGRRDEAFVHFAIALDLLLGSEGRSSDSVAVRASTLVHRQRNLRLDEQVRRLKKLYGLRSKYVHEGQSVSGDELEEIEMVCTEILWALLQVSGKQDFTNVDEWIRKLDFLAASINANQALPEVEFQALGIPAAGHVRRSPLRVLEMRKELF